MKHCKECDTEYGDDLVFRRWTEGGYLGYPWVWEPEEKDENGKWHPVALNANKPAWSTHLLLRWKEKVRKQKELSRGISKSL
jgi:hypothetical protein